MYKMVAITQEFKEENKIIPSKDLDINQPKLEKKANKFFKCYQEEKWRK